MPGVWANLMTFIGGQKACIGFKFAILETKALLFHLIRAFEFELAVDPKDVVCREMYDFSSLCSDSHLLSL